MMAKTECHRPEMAECGKICKNGAVRRPRLTKSQMGPTGLSLRGMAGEVRIICGGALSSAVEHFLHTEGVAGSNPAARTIFAALGVLDTGLASQARLDSLSQRETTASRFEVWILDPWMGGAERGNRDFVSVGRGFRTAPRACQGRVPKSGRTARCGDRALPTRSRSERTARCGDYALPEMREGTPP